MSTTVKILDRPWSHPDSEYLRNLQRAEIEAIYGRPDSEPGTPPSADDISVFVVAYFFSSSAPTSEWDGEMMVPIACGALRVLSSSSSYSSSSSSLPSERPPLEDNVEAEIKRMYVHADYRGAPWFAAKKVLAALEERAKTNGWMNIGLETGMLQTTAIRFYEREGYRRIPRFGGYVSSENSLCYGKILDR